MPARISSILGVLLLIIVAVISPVLYAGYHDLQSAQTALAGNKYDDAARLFESAAWHLMWRNDLWEQAGLAAYRGGNNAEAIRLLGIAAIKNRFRRRDGKRLAFLIGIATITKQLSLFGRRVRRLIHPMLFFMIASCLSIMRTAIMLPNKML